MAQDVTDDVCDSWEDMIENGILEKKLEELQLKLPKINNTATDDPPPFYPQMKLEDPTRTPYTPQVKILKRPSASGGDTRAVVGGAEKSPSRHPPKTLQQREAEYAEARLRILGSARSEEEQNSPSSNHTSPSLAPSEKRTVAAEVIVTRLPKGPDGTNGFSQHR